MTVAKPRRPYPSQFHPQMDSSIEDLHLVPPRVQAYPVLTTADRVLFVAFVTAWLVASFFFWRWWFQVDHVAGWPQYIITTLAITYDLLAMPLVFIFLIWKMKKPLPRVASTGLRVAMVTAIVPAAESIDVLERTLAAMCAVRYPHDSWVLDEGGDQRVRDLCERYGANYWSRKSIPEFNQPVWPHQAKTKSGNYNSWFVDVAYDRYDYIVQLDTDHAPVESYLDNVLGYFDEPDVAYVALPSVYWNLDDWPSRGSSEQSQIFQGPIQMGYYGWADSPMIIGSHAAYRVAHLKEIGGFAPSRAEDHLDTLRFVQHGYRGVFVPENLATGLGPHTLADYMTQEHQWAFSIAQVLMLYARDSGLMTLRQRLVFLFSELWYSIFAFTYLLLYLLPLVALLTNQPIVSIAFVDFLLYSTPVAGIALLVVAWGYSKGWYRPGTHFFISWQGIILTCARWPIVLIALFNAIISVLFKGGAFNYMVTPKGDRGISARDSIRNAIPYMVLAALPVLVVFVYPWLTESEPPRSAGYIAFALLGALSFTLLIVATIADHIRTNSRVQSGLMRSMVGIAPLVMIVILLASGLTFNVVTNVSKVQAALAYRPETGTMLAQHEITDPPDQDSEVLPAANDPEPTPTAAAVEVVPPVAIEPMEEEAPEPAPVAVDSWLFDLARSGVTFGAYDPNGALADVSGLEHIFTAWARDETGGIPIEAVEESYARGVPVLLSYEPWPLDESTRWVVLSSTSAGAYDDVIRQGARAIAALDQPILVRFGHEMDINLLYPWSGRNPEKYIAAYQHVVDVFRQEGATNVIWVWSPGGMLDAARYYPGDQYVDYVGLTILEYTRWELEAGYGEPRPLKELVGEKYWLFRELGKPMIVAELGVDLVPELKATALEEMVASLPSFPEIRAIVYFNDRNPVTTVTEDRPVWTLSEAEQALLVDALRSATWIEPSPAFGEHARP